MDLPFDGAISTYFNEHAPAEIRGAITRSGKGTILSPTYPHARRLSRKKYEQDLENGSAKVGHGSGVIISLRAT
jgi:hypothetical protein